MITSKTLDALDTGTAFAPRPNGDLLRLHGVDAVDLVHRIAASEIRSLVAGSSRRVVFTDDKGRVIDAALAWLGPELTLLAGPGRGPDLRAWIERWIIMEDVRVHADDAHVVFDLTRDAARVPTDARIVDAGPNPTTIALPIRAHAIVAADQAVATRTALAAHTTEVDDAAVAAWCVRAGVARPGPGLRSGCHPLELGWRSWVSFTKGCYIGQEVVARLDTYDKVKRHPVVITCERPMEIGAVVRVESRRAGVVFESAVIDGRAHAVAVIEREVPMGTNLEIENAGAGILARIPAPPTA